MSLPEYRVDVALTTLPDEPSPAWVDVTSRVLFSSGISIQRGRGDEFESIGPSSLSLIVNNEDGWASPDNPDGAYYPNVKVGRLIRVSSLGNLLTANAASMETSIADWVSGGSVNPTRTWSNTRAWIGSRSLLVTWGTGGVFPLVQTTVSGLTVGETYTISTYVWVPTGSPDVLLAVGGGGGVGPSTALKDQWVRLTYTIAAVLTSHPIQIWPATSPTAGQQVWVDATMMSTGPIAAAYTETPLTDRFFGNIISYEPTWPGGNSSSSYVAIRATSRMAKLARGAELRDIVSSEIELDLPSAHYTLGEPTGALKANDSSGNSMPTLFQSGSGAAVTFGSGIGPGTDGLTAATFAGGKHLYRGDAYSIVEPSFTVAIVTSTVSCNVFGFDVTATTFGALPYWVRVSISAAGKLVVSRESTVGAWSMTGATTVTDGALHVISLVCGSAATTLYVDGVSDVTTGNVITPAMRSVRLGNAFEIATVDVGTAFTGTMAHFAIFDSTLTSARVADQAESMLTGFAGDGSGARIERLASYAGIPAMYVSAETGSATNLPLRDTTGRTPIDLMQEVATAENGTLFDGRSGVLTFQGRDHRYIGASVATFAPATDLAPVLDDFGLANDVTATGDDGIVALVKDQDSIEAHGYYRVDIELMTTDEGDAQRAAAWRVGSTAQPVTRIPTATANLHGMSTATRNAVLAVEIGDRITLTNLPDQAPASTMDFFVEGYSEQINPMSHAITFNLSPAAIYDVWVLGDTTLSVLGTTTRLAY